MIEQQIKLKGGEEGKFFMAGGDSCRKGVQTLAAEGTEEMDAEAEKMDVVTGKGFSFLDGMPRWVEGYRSVGFQGTYLYRAIEELRKMRQSQSKIFLGFTSNLVSSGLRDILCYLVKNKHVDVIVTTAGGVEEDLIKTLRPSRLGEFSMCGEDLRERGLNRVGNVLIPNENYIAFEKWLTSQLDRITRGDVPSEEKDRSGEDIRGFSKVGGKAIITPSRLIYELGRAIGSEDSICYWAYRNKIPVYSPAITDGSIGDIITFYKGSSSLAIDAVEDILKINSEGLFCKSTGALVLGAGLVKHHILNSNLFRNGLDYCVLINTAQEYDGSDAGARVDEAVSWGKVKAGTTAVKLHADATIVLPIIVGAVWPPEARK